MLDAPLKKEILKIFEDANSVVLFGSYARNEEKETSDIDILVISDKKIERKKIVKLFPEKYRKVLSIIYLTKKNSLTL